MLPSAEKDALMRPLETQTLPDAEAEVLPSAMTNALMCPLKTRALEHAESPDLFDETRCYDDGKSSDADASCGDNGDTTDTEDAKCINVEQKTKKRKK